MQGAQLYTDTKREEETREIGREWETETEGKAQRGERDKEIQRDKMRRHGEREKEMPRQRGTKIWGEIKRKGEKRFRKKTQR